MGGGTRGRHGHWTQLNLAVCSSREKQSFGPLGPLGPLGPQALCAQLVGARGAPGLCAALRLQTQCSCLGYRQGGQGSVPVAAYTSVRFCSPPHVPPNCTITPTLSNNKISKKKSGSFP